MTIYPDYLRPSDLDPEQFGRIEDYKFSDYQQYADFFSGILRLDPRYKGNLDELEDAVCKEASIGNPTRIVDIGCGSGAWLRSIAQSDSKQSAIHQGRIKLYGIDVNFSSDRLIKEIPYLQKLKITVNGGNIEQQMVGKPFLVSYFENKPVDLAIARNVAWTLRDPIGSLLIPGLQILKPDGHLLISNFPTGDVFSPEDANRFEIETTQRGLIWENGYVYAPRRPEPALFEYFSQMQQIPLGNNPKERQHYRLPSLS